MPTYEYRCVDCGNRLEVVQSFSDPPLEVCHACGGRMRKVFHPVGIQFKGGGFYSTEKRSTQRAESKDGKADDKSTDAAPAKEPSKGESKSSSEA